jgi:hypothetical protein
MSSITVNDVQGTTTPTTVKVTYTIKDSHSTSAVSNVEVTGDTTSIVVTSGTSGSVTLDRVTDELVDGTDNHVANCTVDTSGVGAGYDPATC